MKLSVVPAETLARKGHHDPEPWVREDTLRPEDGVDGDRRARRARTERGERNAEARLARRGAGSVLVVLLLAARLSFDVELARALTDDEDRERVRVET